jgi:hypothetical protein
LDALIEKRDNFKANQEKATAENKRKAEERIAKLTISESGEITESPEKPAEVEATACKCSKDVSKVHQLSADLPSAVTPNTLLPFFLFLIEMLFCWCPFMTPTESITVH